MLYLKLKGYDGKRQKIKSWGQEGSDHGRRWALILLFIQEIRGTNEVLSRRVT